MDNTIDFQPYNALPTQAQSPALDFTPVETPTTTPGIPEAALRGAVQGATLNTAPMIQGGAEAGAESLQNLLTGKQGDDFLKLYRRYQQDAQAKMNASKKAHPYAYGGGQLAGAVGLGLGTGGLGGGASLTELAGEGALPFAGGLAERGATGALIGGGMSAAESKGNLDTTEGRNQMAQDALTGGATGAIAAPALGAAGEAIGGAFSDLAGNIGDYLQSAAEDSPTLKRLVMAFQRGQEGKGFKGLAVERELSGNINDSADDLASTMMNARQGLSKNLGDTLQSGDEISPQGFVQDAQRDLATLPEDSQDLNLADTRDYQQLKSTVDRFQTALGSDPNTTTSPEELFNLRRDLGQLQQKTQEPVVRQKISDFMSQVDDQLQEIPGYQEALQNLKTIPAQTAELFTNKPLNEFSTQQEAQDALQNGLSDTIRKLGGYGARDADIKARDSFYQLQNNFRDIAEKNPDLFQALGLSNIQTKLKQAQSVSDLEEIRQLINKRTPHGGMLEQLVNSSILAPLKVLAGGGNSPTGVLLQSANRAGWLGSKVGNISNTLYNASDPVLYEVSNVLKNAGYDGLSDTLQRALTDKNQALKNAALFSLQQNPQARAILYMSDKENAK